VDTRPALHSGRSHRSPGAAQDEQRPVFDIKAPEGSFDGGATIVIGAQVGRMASRPLRAPVVSRYLDLAQELSSSTAQLISTHVHEDAVEPSIEA